MTQYLLSMYQPAGPIPPMEVLGPIMKELHAIREEMIASNSWVFAGGLHDPSTATVVRVKDGEALTTDGPFVEGKEYLGGFTVIRAADLDAALEWAKRMSKVTRLPIEVRPFREDFSNR